MVLRSLTRESARTNGIQQVDGLDRAYL